MKKSIFKISLIVLIISISFISGVLASSNFEEITAYLNKGVSMTWNGEPFYVYEEDGTRLYPISYKGRNYIPARFVAEKSGVKVGWNPEEFAITFTDPSYIEPQIVKGTYKKVGNGTIRILDDMSDVTESGFNIEETLPYDENGIHKIKLSWASDDLKEKGAAHVLYVNAFKEKILTEGFNLVSSETLNNGHSRNIYVDENDSLNLEVYSSDSEIVMNAKIIVKGTYKKVGNGTRRILDDMSNVTELGFNIEETLMYEEKGMHVIKLSWASGNLKEKGAAHILFADTFCKELRKEFNELYFSIKNNGHIIGSYVDAMETFSIDINTSYAEIVITAQIL